MGWLILSYVLASSSLFGFANTVTSNRPVVDAIVNSQVDAQNKLPPTKALDMPQWTRSTRTLEVRTLMQVEEALRTEVGALNVAITSRTLDLNRPIIIDRPFTMLSGITQDGGLLGNSTWGGTTIICRGNNATMEIRAKDVVLSGFSFRACPSPVLVLNHTDSLTEEEGRVLVANSTFASSSVGQKGGAVALVNAEVSFSNCTFQGNEATVHGGAMYAQGSVVDLFSCQFKNNSGTDLGGAVYLEDSQLHLQECVFEDNAAVSRGGAIYSRVTPGSTAPAKVVVIGSMFERNVAGKEDSLGGALFISGPLLSVYNSTFRENQATSFGAAVVLAGVVPDEQHQIFNSTFHRNNGSDTLLVKETTAELLGVAMSEEVGNGVFASLGSLTLNECQFYDNLLGAVYAEDSEVIISWSSFMNNTAEEFGADVYNYNSNVSIQHSQFQGGKADQGGSIYSVEGSTIRLSNTSFSGYEVSKEGGALGGSSTTWILSNVSLEGNQAASGGGGAMYCSACNVTLSACRLTNNTAMMGGALQLKGGTSVVVSSLLARNTAELYGGAAVWSLVDDVEITSTMFSDNEAAIGGGVTMTGLRLHILNGSFVDNRAGGQAEEVSFIRLPYGVLPGGTGGALHLHGVQDVVIEQSEFRNNSGLGDGGGLHGSSVSNMTISGTIMRENRAGQRGGAAALSLMQHSLLVDALTCEDNLAGQGGCLASWALGSSDVEVRRSMIRNNQAEAQSGGGLLFQGLQSVLLRNTSLVTNLAATYGGGLSCRLCNQLEVENCKVEENLAGKGGGGLHVVGCVESLIVNSTLEVNTAESGGGALVVDGEILSVRSTMVAGNKAGPQDAGYASNLLDCSSPGVGGGLCWELRRAAFIANTTIQNNSADYGGGCFAGGPEASADLSNVTLKDNSATIAGGGLYMKSSRMLSMDNTTQGHEGYLKTLKRLHLTNKVTSPSGYGPGLATDPDQLAAPLQPVVVGQGERFNLTVVLRDQVGSQVTHPDHPLLPQLLVMSLRDVAAGQAGGSMASCRGPRPSSQTSEVRGQTRVLPTENGEFQFEGLQISSTSRSLMALELLVRELGEGGTCWSASLDLQPCRIGQVVDGRDCVPCVAPTQFSFHSQGSCQECPLHAECSGARVRAAPGYWQSSSRSAQMHSCPQASACVDQESEQLREMFDWSSQSYDRVFNLTQGAEQCARGYEGILCDRCTEGHGDFNGRCVSCPPLAVGIIIFVVARFVEVAMIAGAVYWVGRRFPKEETLQLMVHKVVTSSEVLQESSPGNAQELIGTATPQAILRHQRLQQVHLAFSYLQLIGIILSLSVAHQLPLWAMATITALAPTPYLTLRYIPMECLRLPRGVAQPLLDVAVPWMAVTMAAALMVVAYHQRARGGSTWGRSIFKYLDGLSEGLHSQQSRSLSGLTRFLTGQGQLPLMTLSMFLPQLLYTLIHTNTCIELDDPGNRVPGEVLAAVGSFWSADLQVTCHSPRHRGTAIAVSVLAAPLVLVYVLLAVLQLAGAWGRKPGRPQGPLVMHGSLALEAIKVALILTSTLIPSAERTHQVLAAIGACLLVMCLALLSGGAMISQLLAIVQLNLVLLALGNPSGHVSICWVVALLLVVLHLGGLTWSARAPSPGKKAWVAEEIAPPGALDVPSRALVTPLGPIEQQTGHC